MDGAEPEWIAWWRSLPDPASVRKAGGAPRGGISGTDRDYFTRDCGMLALAVAHLTGWQPVEWLDESNAIHCLVRLPGGRLLDAGGLHDPGEYPGACTLVPCSCESCTEWNQPGVLADAQRLLRSIEPWCDDDYLDGA